MKNKPMCIGYSAECPLHISFYYGENTDRCEISEACYKMWFERGGLLGWEGVEKYGEKAWYEDNVTNNRAVGVA